MAKFKLILGLGNPGEEYQYTYHNTGILAARHFAMETEFKKDSSGLFEYAKSGNGTIIATSLVFMNESGRAAAAAARKFHLTPQDILVVHDESDMTLGTFKFSFNRNAAGNHGVESVIQSLGTKEFTRLRIGIRDAEDNGKASNFILRKIPKVKLKILQTVFDEANIVLGAENSKE